MRPILVWSSLAAIAAAAALAAAAHAAPVSPSPIVVDTDATIEPATGDVYEVNGFVLQNPTASTSDDTPLYSAVGESLGMTWGAWKRPRVHTAVTELGGRLDLVGLDVSGLIPGGVYSVFYYASGLPGGGDTVNPLCPIETALALHSLNPRQAPDASSFVAGRNGTARFAGSATGSLLGAAILVFELIYHPDGATFGDLPNRSEFETQRGDCRSSFGYDAFRQTLVVQRFE